VIIDFSLRPPYKSLGNMTLFVPNTLVAMAAEMGMKPADSAMQRSTDLLVKEMEEAGIVHGVCHGRSRDGSLTEDLLALTKEYPGKFTGFPGIDLTDMDKAYEETRVSLDELGFTGVMLEPGMRVPAIYPDDAGLYPIYQLCSQRNAKVLLTLSGETGPDITYSSPIYADRVAGDFPNVDFIIRHACWPWTMEACGMAKRRPNVYLCPGVYMGMPGYMNWVEAANTYLADRMLFGTAFPVVPLKPMVEIFQKLPFRDGVKEKVEYQNAARLLNLPA